MVDRLDDDEIQFIAHGTGMSHGYDAITVALAREVQEWRRLDAERPTCATCDGFGWVVIDEPFRPPYGEQRVCPDCTDGKVPWRFAVAASDGEPRAD